jgi:hypothetical protein
MGAHTPRCGDHVRHGPTGETWVVAFADTKTGELAWAGWPPGRARIADCEVVYQCPDQTHRDSVESWRNSADSSTRDHVLRLYGATPAHG